MGDGSGAGEGGEMGVGQEREPARAGVSGAPVTPTSPTRLPGLQQTDRGPKTHTRPDTPNLPCPFPPSLLPTCAPMSLTCTASPHSAP